LDLIASGHAEPVPQVGESSYAPKLTTEDAQVLWQVPAFAVDRQVRACTPAPGAWTTIDGERLGIGPVVGTEGPDLAVLAPGELLVGKRDVLVGTLTDPVRLGQVRPPGKRDMSAADWARGARVESGTVLGPREGDDA
jgi:methionyl-tRNA formyltransferase